jgi:hypothetical protein
MTDAPADTIAAERLDFRSRCWYCRIEAEPALLQRRDPHGRQAPKHRIHCFGGSFAPPSSHHTSTTM